MTTVFTEKNIQKTISKDSEWYLVSHKRIKNKKEKKPYHEEILCEICNIKKNTTKIYNSIFSKNGSMLCNDCCVNECCPGCGWESGGDVCSSCRRGI